MKRIMIILILIIFPLRVGAISASSYIVLEYHFVGKAHFSLIKSTDLDISKSFF